MSDDKSQHAPQDANRVSLTEPYEVQYWTKRFEVSREQLEEAVQEVGHGVNAIAEHLNKSGVR